MNKLKVFMSLMVFVLASSAIFAGSDIPTRYLINKFYSTKTKIVLEEQPVGYNILLKQAVQRFWRLTDYEFISYDEFKEQKSNENFSFIVLTETQFDKDEVPVNYYFVNLLLGDENAQTLTNMPELAAIPLSYADINPEKHFYKLNSIIAFMQNHLIRVRDHRFPFALRGMKYYHKYLPNIRKQKELWIVKSDIAETIRDSAAIHDIYPYYIRYVTHKQIEKAIDQRRNNVVYLHKVGPEGESVRKGRSIKILFGAADARIYFYKHHIIEEERPDGFLEKDFKRLKRWCLF